MSFYPKNDKQTNLGFFVSCFGLLGCLWSLHTEFLDLPDSSQFTPPIPFFDYVLHYRPDFLISNVILCLGVLLFVSCMFTFHFGKKNMPHSLWLLGMLALLAWIFPYLVLLLTFFFFFHD